MMQRFLPLMSSTLTLRHVSTVFHRLRPIIFIGIFSLLVSVNLVFAAGPYIQINNGQSINITGTEQPQISVQFGNTGAAISDVRVRCEWDNLIRFTGQAQNGPFPSSQFSPPSGAARAQLNFPALAVVDPASLPNLPTGQSYNVAFNIRLALPSATFKGFAGNVQCFLLSSNSTVLATSAVTTVNVR
jgi:hypothetical protein